MFNQPVMPIVAFQVRSPKSDGGVAPIRSSLGGLPEMDLLVSTPKFSPTLALSPITTISSVYHTLATIKGPGHPNPLCVVASSHKGTNPPQPGHSSILFIFRG
ncbi:hypothetical protein PTI98_000794 [Pleurotus ostreatus]|nr:hypothetical protein PTI98_000794 [Pleurotus ostreatus]